MINKVELLGRLAGDPEIRTSQDGSKMARFRMITSEVFKRQGETEWTERTEGHNVVVFDHQIKTLQDRAKKGMMIYVIGVLRTRSWDNDGETRYATEVTVNGHHTTLRLLGYLTWERPQTQNQAQTQTQNPQDNQSGGYDHPLDSSDDWK